MDSESEVESELPPVLFGSGSSFLQDENANTVMNAINNIFFHKRVVTMFK